MQFNRQSDPVFSQPEPRAMPVTWGHRSDLVSPVEVNRYRSVPVE